MIDWTPLESLTGDAINSLPQPQANAIGEDTQRRDTGDPQSNEPQQPDSTRPKPNP